MSILLAAVAPAVPTCVNEEHQSLQNMTKNQQTRDTKSFTHTTNFSKTTK